MIKAKSLANIRYKTKQGFIYFKQNILTYEDATEGRFFPKDPVLWQKNGRNRLQMMLNSSPLLPIAEDLGLIPKIV
ncbi:MAG: hypothetical protein K940chlam5_00341 [Candidatus Anoxychlamydiales bacterium]|nr:hypothetical protein [Candidatus Anoxychlamydiales bacterium]